MAYIRREKKVFRRKEISGDVRVQNPTSKSAQADPEIVDEAANSEVIYDDLVKANLLVEAEETLEALEDLVKEQLDEIAILLDPDKEFELVKAVSTLAGEPHLTLDGEIIQMAADLSMDGPIHINGFDPVAAVLGLYGGEDRPNVPVPELFMDCLEMQELQNVPSPEDNNYQTTSVDEVHIEVEKVKTLSIYAKLWKIFKYYPGVDIKKFLKKIRNRWTKRPVNRAIRWVECRMINPGWFLLTGEARTCKPGEEADDPLEQDEVYNLTAEDIEGTGLDCIEAAGMVMQHIERTMPKNTALKNMAFAMEERAYHEARKFSILSGGIKDKKMHASTINSLQEKTKNIPRYKKRYYDHKDTFITSDLGKDVIMKATNG